ncbi:sporulation protein [Halobacillus litoralis]|uniref:sporulation protein n=1 Tax=Halobacillus litoralis TaxID=45668 RepID=UPI001CD7FF57|nr:sporulation protein [Halobacillus litoralis]MCA0969429.1 sporulation protein [Halobacillus litoralis]
MFKKLLASVGVGAAKVDTQLDKDQFIPGEEVTGKVVIKGGDVDQSIDAINLFLMTEAVREVDDRKVKEKVSLEKYLVTQDLVISAGETKEFPFSVHLPYHVPASLSRLPIWFETGLDIPMALDPQDRDPVKIAPHPYVESILDALNHLGFSVRKVEMEYSKKLGYVQEFEFQPRGEFRSYLDELEAIFFLYEDRIEVFLEVDRRARGLGGLFAEALEMDESKVKLSFNKAELANPTTLTEQLRATIQRYSQ